MDEEDIDQRSDATIDHEDVDHEEQTDRSGKKPNNGNGKTKSKKIGQYILGKSIGEGTFGKVKQGMHIHTGEKVAVKILEKDKIQDVADVERVAREIHILKIVRHPCVVQLYEIIETQKQLYLIMEFANGGELFDFIVEQQRVEEREACYYFQQIIAGVDYISKLGIVHRDLKPENLLLDHNRTIKLVDFGLSNTYKPGETLKTACGSPCYAAPEMIAGKRYTGTNVDLWSCGVILFAMICGFLPFEDPNTSQLYKKILNAEYKIPSFVSKDGADILKGILETDADKRLTIEQIREHPWYKQHQETRHNGIIVGSDQIPVDDALLEEIKKFDYDLDYARKCIEANKHNDVTASYNLLLKSKLREGKMTIQEAYECKNDLASLMKRHPRFQNLTDNMPDRLKNTNRKDQNANSMPPKTRIPKEIEDPNTDRDSTNGKLKPKVLKIDPELEKEIKSKKRTGSTGGSSAKEAEIIGAEHIKKSGSPSLSPMGHPQFPISKGPLLKQILARGNPQMTVSHSSKNEKLLKRERSNNSKNNLPKKRNKISKNSIDFAHLFKNAHQNKKRTNHKGISQSDLSAGTPMGIGNVGPPPISIGFGIPRGRHKKAATAFDYENLNNSFQVDRYRHNTITATPSQRTKRKRKGSKKVRVSCDLNNSLVLNSKTTPMSKKKMVSLMNSTINHQMLDISARPVSVLNKTIYTTGLREQISHFPSLMFQKKIKKKKFRVRSRGGSPKNGKAIAHNLYQAYMRGNNSSKVKSSVGYNTVVLNNSMSLVRPKKTTNIPNRKITLSQTSKQPYKKILKER